MEPWLKRVHNEFDLFVSAFTIDCEECCYCETGQRLRQQRDDEEQQKAFPYRFPDGRIPFRRRAPSRSQRKRMARLEENPESSWLAFALNVTGTLEQRMPGGLPYALSEAEQGDERRAAPLMKDA